MGIFSTRLERYLEQLAKGNILFFQEAYYADAFGYGLPVNLRNGQYERLSNNKPLLNTNYIFWMDGNSGKLYSETCSYIGDSPDKLDERITDDDNTSLYYLFCLSEKPIEEIIKKTDDTPRYIDEKAMTLGLKYLAFLLKCVYDTVSITVEGTTGAVSMRDVSNALSNINISYESFQEENSNNSLDMETILNALKLLADCKRSNGMNDSLRFRKDFNSPSRAYLETSKLQKNGIDDYKYVGSKDDKGISKRS